MLKLSIKQHRSPTLKPALMALALGLTACSSGGSSSQALTAPASNGAPKPSSPSSPSAPSTPSSTSLMLTRGAASPAARHVSTQTRDLVLLQASLENPSSQEAVLKSLSIMAQGDLDDSQAYQELQLIHDRAGDGFPDASDPILATGNFSQDDGSLAFALNESIDASDQMFLLVRARLNNQSLASRRFAVRIDSVNDLRAESMTGQNIQVQGSAVSGAWFTLGQWTASTEIVALDEEVLNPKVVADAQGKLYMTFFRNHNFRSDVYYSYFNGRFWSTPFNISDSAQTSWRQDIAVDNAGIPHVVWEQMNPGTNSRDIFYSRFDAASFSWTSPANLSNSSTDEGLPKVTCDSLGQVHVIWEQGSVLGGQDIVHQVFDGQSWSSPTNLSNSAGYSAKGALSLTAAGDLAVAWEDTAGADFVIKLRVQQGGQWQADETVAQSIDPLGAPSLAPLSTGELAIAYTGFNGQGQSVYVKERHNAQWSQTVEVSVGHSLAERPALTAGRGQDLLHLVWRGTVSATSPSDVFAVSLGAQGWSSPENVSRSAGPSETPSVALLGNDQPLVLFADRSSGRYRIRESRRDPFGWEAASVLMSSQTQVSRPVLGRDRKGQVHAVWHVDAGGNFEIFHAIHDGLTWSTPENISRSANASYKPSLTVSEDGRVHVLYEEFHQGQARIMHVIGEAGVWSPAQALPNPSTAQAYSPSLQALPGNALLAVWSEESAAGSFDILAARFTNGQWQSPENISQSGPDSFQAQVAVNSQGAVVVWQESVAGQDQILESQWDGQAWTAPTPLIAGRDAQVAFDSAGRLHGVFAATGSNNQSAVFYISKDLGQAATAPEALPGSGSEQYSPALVVDGSRVHVVWEDKALGDAELFLSTLDAGQWSTPSNLSQTASHSNRPSVIVDAGGVLHVAWHEAFNGTEQIQHRQQR